MQVLLYKSLLGVKFLCSIPKFLNATCILNSIAVGSCRYNIINDIKLNLFSYCLYFLQNGLGQFCFVPFGVVCLLTALYIGLVLPETKGKTLPMITSAFQRLNFHNKEKTGPKCKDVHYQLGEVHHSTAF